MMRNLATLLFLVVGCTSNDTSSKHDYVIEGDQCKIYNDAQTCDSDSNCLWFDLGIACQPGQTCISGECQSKISGSGSGSSGSGGGSGSGSTGCVCSDGGVCFEQIGGPAQQSGTQPEIQCYPPSACPGGCSSVCDEIVGQGTCTLDPNVENLCLCDNGIR